LQLSDLKNRLTEEDIDQELICTGNRIKRCSNSKKYLPSFAEGTPFVQR
jgi:hypothetical protein